MKSIFNVHFRILPFHLYTMSILSRGHILKYTFDLLYIPEHLKEEGINI